MRARIRFMLPVAATLTALLVAGPAFAAWPIDSKVNLQIPSTANQTGATSVRPYGVTGPRS